MPGSFMPGGRIPPTFLVISSSALRCASFNAATIRSWSIPTSSFETTSGSIFKDWTCLAPLTTTVTMPPPALPRRAARTSASADAPASAARSSSCPGCSHFLDVADLRGKDFEHRLDAGVGHRLFAKRRLLVVGSARRGLTAVLRRLGGRRAAVELDAAHGNAPAGHLLRDRLEPGAVLLEHVEQRPLVRREGEGDGIAGNLDLLRLRAHGAVEHHLRPADLVEQRVLEISGPGGRGFGRLRQDRRSGRFRRPR